MVDAAAPPAWLVRNRDKLTDVLIFTVPNSLLTGALLSLKDGALGKGWQVLWLVPAACLLAVILYRGIRRADAPLRSWRWLALLGSFLVAFSVLAGTDSLRWNSVEPADRTIAAREWLVPLRAGDWHYWFARRQPADPDRLQVLLLDPPADGSPRLLEAELIELAARMQKGDAPLGIGLDMYFEGVRPVEDARLCAAIEEARAKGIEVASGFTRRRDRNGHYLRWPAELPLACQRQQDMGHLVGYADVDGRVRSQWLQLQGGVVGPSLSLLAARKIAGKELPLPADNILRYLPPTVPVAPLSMAELRASPVLLQQQYLLVGLKVPEDRFITPFGPLSGTVIQAYAVHSLLTGHYITRPSAIWSIVLILAGCLLLMNIAARKPNGRWLPATAAGLTVLVCVLAALAMYFWLVWLDVIYAATAFWLWALVLLTARRRVSRSTTGPALSPPLPAADRVPPAAAEDGTGSG